MGTMRHTELPDRNQNRTIVLLYSFIMLISLIFLVSLLVQTDQSAEAILASTNETKLLPLVINTWAFREANQAAWDRLTQQPWSSGMDALVAGCSMCEELQCDGTVGYGGSPDEKGHTKLDALVMDGKTMKIGAVAALVDVKNAIGVARAVLDHTQHTLLVGGDARDFAESMGFSTSSLDTGKSLEMWQKWKAGKCQPNFWIDVLPDPRQSCGPYKPLKSHGATAAHHSYKVDRWNHDTIGMIVIDEYGRLVAGTSTNGAKFKIPGRVGDSPIPGAGAYADNHVGAAVATGDGDVMMRFLPSLLAVEAMRAGKSPTEAAEIPLIRILQYYPNFQGALVAANRHGQYGAACAGIEKFPFAIANDDSGTRIEITECIHIA